MSEKVKAFAYYGVTLTDEQWSWSGVTPFGEIVALLWTDEFNYQTKPAIYSTFGRNVEQWIDHPGNRERIKLFKESLANQRGRFRVVIAKAVDENADLRTVEEAHPGGDMVMELTALEERTGEFSAVMLGS